MRPYARELTVAMSFFAVSTACTISVPRLVAKIVDVVLVDAKIPFHPWALFLSGLMLTKVVADLSYKWRVTKLGQTMTLGLRQEVFAKLATFPLAFFDVNSSGRLISRCVNDVTNLSAFFTANFFTALSDLVVISGCSVMLLFLNPIGGLVVLLMLLPLTVYMMNTVQAQMRYGKEQRHLLSRLSSHTGDTMNNLAVLHSQPFARKWSRRHARLQTLFAGFNLRGILTWGAFSSTHVVVMGVTYTLVILLGIHGLKHHSMTLGQFIASCTYVTLIFDPFIDIADKLNTVVTALGSAKRLRGFALVPHERAERGAGSAGAAPTGDIVLKDVHFAYRQDRPLFESLNLTLPEGEVTALVGRTGSGKTTLAHLLLGLYPLQRGLIAWGTEDFLAFSPERRSRWIAQVSQDLFLFTDTLRENLRLWREDVTDEQIFERLARVNLAEKTRALPQGLDTLVKAETLPFSQGEKQLLLLCRALLQDPRLLVFDEATANLDHLTEDKWLHQVEELFRGRTTLFIAHRVETLRLAHRIVVMNQGKIVRVITKEAGAAIDEAELHS